MENSIVLYSLNGLYFSDFDIFISDSEGLLDFPKIRENLGYTWDEYDGIQISKSKKPRFEPKEIRLKGWVEGKDLDDMNFKFKKILSEFKKSYTQRLVVEAFDQNPLVFDVILQGDVKLSKVFRKGEMVGFFELNMLEPNPIKRTFKLIGNTLQMSTDSEKWIDVNIDGQSVSAKGPSNFNQNLNRRSLSPFPYLGRNLMVENNVELNKRGIYQIDLPKISKYLDLGSVLYTNFDLKSQNPETVKANISGRFLSLTNQFNSNAGYQNFSGNLKVVKDKFDHAFNFLKYSSNLNTGQITTGTNNDYSTGAFPEGTNAVNIDCNGPGSLKINLGDNLETGMVVGEKYTLTFQLFINIDQLGSVYLSTPNGLSTFPVNGSGIAKEWENKVTFTYTEDLKNLGMILTINYLSAISFTTGIYMLVKGTEPAEWAPSISDPEYPSFHSDTNYLTFTGTNYSLKNIFIGKALPGQKWEISPENVHYINIYGDLSNITTNAIEI